MVTMPPRTPIRYAEDEFGVSNWPGWLDVMDVRRDREGHPRAPRPHGQASDAAPVYARMNYGRWLADCECKASTMLFRGPSGAWFWCAACGNATTGGKLRPVIWPARRSQLDLDKGSLPAPLANWDPGDDEKTTNYPPNDRGGD